MGMLSIGIDIGSFSIKVAKVRSSSKGYELLHISEYPLSQDPSKDNQIEIIEILRDIRGRYYEDGAQFVVGAHQYEVTARRREFPFRERHKILKSLPFELEDDIPFSNETAIFDAKVTHFVGNQAHVLAVACPKEHVLQILKRITDAGYEPNIISVDGLAFANTFEEWREAPWEYPPNQQGLPEAASVDLILNIGHRTTTAILIKDGYLLDIRMIDWGGRDIAESLASHYSLHYIEALKELRKKAFILTQNEGASRDQIALSEVIKTSVDSFSHKLRLTLLEMQNLHKVQIRQAILTGGVSQLRNLAPYLTQKIEVACNRLATLDRMPQLDFAGSPNNEAAAITAIGLAIEGLKRPKNPAINLLKDEFAKQSESLRLFWEKWGHAVNVAALAFVAVFFWGVFRESFTLNNSEVAYEKLREQAKNIMGTRGPKISERNIRTYIREQDQKLKAKEMIEGLQNINSGLDVIKRLSSIAPSKSLGGMNIFELKINSDSVSLRGEASKAEFIQQLQRSLQSVAKEGKLQTDTPAPATKPGYKSFAYSFKVERQGAR
jgi:general secretion pathway protein L